MIYLKNIVYWLVLWISVPIMFVFAVLALPFDKGINRVGKLWTGILLWVAEHIIGLRYVVRGAENIPDTPCIICSKHQSAWETFALQHIFPLQVFVAKKELFQIPFFGWALKWSGTIGIDRKSGVRATQMLLEQGKIRKQQGLWIVIFPEGTRMPVGERGRYKLGGARMAKLFEMDMIPVALNSGKFWSKNSWLKRPGTIEVMIGKPIAHTSGDEAALMQACEEWIEAQQLHIN